MIPIQNDREIIYDWSLGRDRLTVMFWPNQIHWVWDLDGQYSRKSKSDGRENRTGITMKGEVP